MPEAVRLHGATLVTILWALLFLSFSIPLSTFFLDPEILMAGEILLP